MIVKAVGKTLLFLVFIYSLTHLFIQQVFIECLLYAKHYVGTGMQSGTEKHGSCPRGAHQPALGTWA